MNISRTTLLLATLCFFSAIADNKFAFDGYKLIHIRPQTHSHFEAIATWEHNADFDLWSRVKSTSRAVTALLSPNAFTKYSKLMTQLKMSYTVINENAEEYVFHFFPAFSFSMY